MTNIVSGTISPNFDIANTRTPRLGFVGTRAQCCDGTGANLTSVMGKFISRATENIEYISVLLSNFLVTTNPAIGEYGVGGDTDATCSIEYPLGNDVCVQMTSGRRKNMVVPDVGTLRTDLVRLPFVIPRGAQFAVRIWYSNKRGIIYKTGGMSNFGLGEGINAGQNIPDGTQGPVALGGGFIVPPLAILGYTTKPTFLLVGDSIVEGAGDPQLDQTGATGTIERSIAKRFAYSKISISGEFLTNIINNPNVYYKNRQKLSEFATHIIGELGINDIGGGTTAANHLLNIQTFTKLFPNQCIYWTTLTPRSNSTDAWATDANQTPVLTQRTTVNDQIRRGLPGISGCIDIADVLETGRNTGKWIYPAYTTDGLHPTFLGDRLVEQSNAFRVFDLIN